MITKEEISEILRFIWEQRICSGDIYKIIGFEYPPIQRFDFLLWNMILRMEEKFEIKGLQPQYDDGVSQQGHEKHFFKNYKAGFDKRVEDEGCEGQALVRVDMSDLDMRDKRDLEKKIGGLYSVLKEKGRITFESGSPSGPPIYIPGTSMPVEFPYKSNGGRLEGEIRRIFRKAIEQLSDNPDGSKKSIPNKKNLLIVASAYLNPNEVRQILFAVAEEEEFWGKIDRVFLSYGVWKTNCGGEKIFDKTEQVYPAA